MAEEKLAPSNPPRARCILRIRLPPAWTPDEDARLRRLAKENGFHHWHRVARQMPGRSVRFCRDRWRHHLARDVYHRPFTASDDEELIRLHQRLGGRWKDIGRAVYGRTSRVMKRRWIDLRKNCPRKAYCPPELPSEDLDIMESEPEPEESLSGQPPALQQQEPHADVLASSFVGSCSLACDSMDPRAGSLALGFACMAV